MNIPTSQMPEKLHYWKRPENDLPYYKYQNQIKVHKTVVIWYTEILAICTLKFSAILSASQKNN